MTTLGKSLVGSLLGIALLTASAEASAFCRKTTCKPDNEKCDIDAAGCTMTGNPLRWRKVPIEYRFSSAPPGLLVREEARAAIRAAFHRWSDTLCGPQQRRTSLRFVEGEDINTEKALAAGVRGAEPFGIYFRDRGWPYEGREDSTLAQTNTFFGKTSGLIEYSDMEINTGTQSFSTKDEETGVDLQSVMTHEVGHYIGLDHSKVAASIMVDSYCQREGRCEKGKVAARRLSQDDIDAVCFMYPPDGFDAEPEPAQPLGCAASPSSSSSLAAAFGLAVPLAVLAFRRRRFVS